MREDIEQKKEYLRKFENSQRAIERLDDSIEQLRLMKMCPCVNMDGMPHSTGVSDLSNYVSLVDEYERELKELRYKRMVEYQTVLRSIELLEKEVLKDILYHRYIRLKKWEDICVDLGMSWKHMHRLHTKALIQIEIS